MTKIFRGLPAGAAINRAARLIGNADFTGMSGAQMFGPSGESPAPRPLRCEFSDEAKLRALTRHLVDIHGEARTIEILEGAVEEAHTRAAELRDLDHRARVAQGFGEVEA